MAIGLVPVLLILLFIALLIVGRSQLKKGANAAVANGAVLLLLALVLGSLALGVAGSGVQW